MKLEELIKLEEKLMNYEISNKFLINFNDYMNLIRILRNIGEVTTNYFILMKEYDNKLKNDEISNEERKKKLIDFNNNLLSTEIELDYNSINNFITKYDIL